MSMTRLTALSLAAGLAATVAADGVTDFESGADGWSGPAGSGGSTIIDPANGNPAGNIYTVFNDFGITFRNSTNPDFVTDYSALGSFTFSFDVKIDYINFFGQDATRPFMVEFRDYDNPPGSYPWVSVFYSHGWFGESADWMTMSVTVDDSTQAALPAGWGGYGAENEFGEPLLPADRTFADVLAGVDEVVISTLEPGWFFGFTDFEVRIDNIELTSGGTPCATDLDDSGDTGFNDLVSLLSAWGPCSPPCTGDFDESGDIGFNDVVTLLSAWGPCS